MGEPSFKPTSSKWAQSMGIRTRRQEINWYARQFNLSPKTYQKVIADVKREKPGLLKDLGEIRTKLRAQATPVSGGLPKGIDALPIDHRANPALRAWSNWQRSLGDSSASSDVYDGLKRLFLGVG